MAHASLQWRRFRRVPLDGVETQRYSVMICRDGEQNLPEVAAVVAAAHKATSGSAFA